MRQAVCERDGRYIGMYVVLQNEPKKVEALYNTSVTSKQNALCGGMCCGNMCHKTPMKGI